MKVFPKKHIKLKDSVFGLSPFVYEALDTANNLYDNIENLCILFNKEFDDIVLCLDYLYAIGMIQIKDERIVKNEISKTI